MENKKGVFRLLLLFWQEKLYNRTDIREGVISDKRAKYILGTAGGKIPSKVHPLIIKAMIEQGLLEITKKIHNEEHYLIKGKPQFSEENINDYYQAAGFWDNLKEKDTKAP